MSASLAAIAIGAIKHESSSETRPSTRRSERHIGNSGVLRVTADVERIYLPEGWYLTMR
jgi:hypothetical protein